MRTRTNKIWSYSDLCFIRKNYATMTQFQLAYHFEVSESVMEACIRRYGFRKYKETWTPESIEEMRQKYPSTNCRNLAKEMGIPYQSVRYALEKYNVLKMRKAKKKTKTI